ncbi:hypothetical protein [Streptomyces vietnamensis]|uniref:hypothetical protein n=1 Tax=Streptomyces vietnamensis TaxID=362257 RepID=UPI0007C7CDCB|nr:hypothetical protein [Streptomyces vietnamensis]
MTALPLRAADRLALFGTLLSVFDAVHPLCDHWVQPSDDARLKGLHGDHYVYADGTPLPDGADPADSDVPVYRASVLGRAAVCRHVRSYTTVQLATALTITRVLGHRVPLRALLAGAAVNAATHLLIDRREPLLKLADRFGKRGYIDHCTATRVGQDGKVTTELFGPGTALMELDVLCTKSVLSTPLRSGHSNATAE